jgi:hypothetical protein
MWFDSFALTTYRVRFFGETFLPFFLQTIEPRRAVYLNLVGSIESQLRDAYARLYESGEENQSTLAKKLGVDRSVVNRRLTGHHNMTIETLADMVWALRKHIDVDIHDPIVTKNSDISVDYRSQSAPIPTVAAVIPVPMEHKYKISVVASS